MAIVINNSTYTKAKNTILTESGGTTIRVPFTTIPNIRLGTDTTENANTRIFSRDFTLSRAYAPEFVIPVVAVTGAAPAVPQVSNYKYFNTSNNTLYLTSESVTGVWEWVSDTTDRSTDPDMRGKCLYVEVTTGRLWNWHQNTAGQQTTAGTTMVQVGYNAADISAIADSVASAVAYAAASAVVSAAQGGQFEDKLYNYTEIE